MVADEGLRGRASPLVHCGKEVAIRHNSDNAAAFLDCGTTGSLDEIVQLQHLPTIFDTNAPKKVTIRPFGRIGLHRINIVAFQTN